MRTNFDELGLLVVALLFGFAYSFQNIGAQYVAPFSFNVVKQIIGVIAIAPLCLRKTNTNHKREFVCGVIIAAILAVFSYLQQVVAIDTNPGKVGFITSMYIIEVPIINWLVYKEKINLQTIIGIVLAVIGLIFLCDLTSLSFSLSDILILICSILLAVQIVIIDKYAKNCDPCKLNFFSFLFTGLFCFVGACFTKETLNIEGYKQAIVPLIYVGLGCAAFGNTLQIFCQKTVDSTTSSLILSLESVFSVIAGYLILDDALGKMELIGCVLMFMGVILCVTANKRKN